MKKILILNGPNLNMLGSREPDIYGETTLDEIRGQCGEHARAHGWKIDFRQSNHEGTLIDWIQETHSNNFDGLIINAAAYTHTSIAIHDALKTLTVPIVEVHLSEPKEREAFRHHSYIEPLAEKIIAGKGAAGYLEAIDFFKTI